MNRFQFVRIKHFFFYFLIKPHYRGKGIHSPFVSNFIKHVLLPKPDKNCVEIQLLREHLKKNTTKIEIEDFGAGSAKNKKNIRRIGEIARNASSTNRKGTLFYNLVKYYQPKTIIELGTSLGIGTLYMAKASPQTAVFTLEGSNELSKIASENFNLLKASNCISLTGRFDDLLPDLLKRTGLINIIYIDGNHTYDATMRYFNLLLDYIQPGSIFIFDDIRWSEGMYKAWREICGKETIKLTIDFFDTGIVFFTPSNNKEHYYVYI